MPELILDSLDTVEESDRGVYVEVDGKFHLDADKYAEVKAQGLKAKTKELLGKLTKANDGLKKFEKIADFEDDDLNEFQTWRENKGKEPPDKGKGSEELQAQFEKARKKDEEKWNTERTSLQSALDEANKLVKGYKLTVPLRQIALDQGVLPEDLDLAMLETQKRFALDENDKIVVLDEDGDPTDVTPEKFFGTLYKVQRPKFYAPSGASGSGAPSSTGNNAGKKTMRRGDFEKMQMSNPQQAAAFMREVNQDKAALVD